MLFAAVRLAAEATILRHDADGEPVTSAMTLVRCGGLGEPRRNSGPQIAAAVNDAAATGGRSNSARSSPSGSSSG